MVAELKAQLWCSGVATHGIAPNTVVIEIVADDGALFKFKDT